MQDSNKYNSKNLARLTLLGISLIALYLIRIAPATNPIPEQKITKSKSESRLNYFLSPAHDPYRNIYLYNQQGKLVKTIDTKTKAAIEWAVPTNNGNFVVIVQDQALKLVSPKGDVLWEIFGGFHHDLDLEDDKVYVLERALRKIAYQGSNVPILDDNITVIDLKKAERISSISLFDTQANQLLKKKLLGELQSLQETSPKVDSWTDTPYDIFHNNSIQVINCNFTWCKEKTALLISAASLNKVFIISMDLQNIFWTSEKIRLDRQHHASLSSDNKILVLDNGFLSGKSRVIKIDPELNKIIWEYPKTKSDFFFTSKMGSVQELKNKNLLITNASNYRAFEIDESSQKIWESNIAGLGNFTKATDNQGIYRVFRIEDQEIINSILE